MKSDMLEKEKARIKERFEKVHVRWSDLKAATEKRWKDLRDAEERMKSVDELLLAFAKKAYEINSWFENAEEDLTDPVRCYSIEQINKLFSVQNEFLSRLDQVNKDLDDIKILDARIRRLVFFICALYLSM